jgi:tetratricopeptide (TPR) repeat protein
VRPRCLRVVSCLVLAQLAQLALLAPVASAQPDPRTKPESPLEQGLESARASDYAKAEKLLPAVQGSGRPEALVALARVNLEQGRFAEAQRFAKQAADGARPSLALVALALRAEIMAATGQVDEAIKLLLPSKDAPDTGGRRVRLELGELLIRSGHRADAEPVLMKFADEYGSDAITSTDFEGLAMVGRAMQLLRHPKEAKRAYDESEKAEVAASGGALHGSARVETLLWRADQFLDKYNTRDAGAVLAEALKIAPHRADTLVAMARAELEDSYDFEAAEKLVRDALAVNPKCTGAFAVTAALALYDMNLDAAGAAVDSGLAVDPSDLELLSLRAATRFLSDDLPGFEAAKRAIFAHNREYSRGLGIVGEFAEWEHRYDDVVRLMKEAVAIDPKDGKAWAELGQMQTRSGGDEAEGVKSLEQWWKVDHYNVRAYNTLEHLYGHWIPEGYDTAAEGPFKFRFPKREKAILERYVPRLLGAAWGSMKTHYMFAPETPVSVEMYADKQHFAVRTSGLGNIGIDGVCFGRMVAAMSPGANPVNWGNVLWHELAHVFAIQKSKSHVPRWFTEGLSEYETMLRRPEWQRELDGDLYAALAQNRIPAAADMNRAFSHSTGQDIEIAYYAASQMVAFAGEQFGFAGITRALELWGEGKRTPEVLKGAFGITADEFDARYRAWERARLARFAGQYAEPHPLRLEDARERVSASPASAAAHAALGQALLHARQVEEARRELDVALKLDPADKDAHFGLARLAAMSNDVRGAGEHLRAIRDAGGDGYALEMHIVEASKALHDRAGERAALESAHRFDPTQVDAVHALYEMATADKRDGDALDMLRAWARLDQHDRDGEWRDLLKKLVDAKLWDEARRVGEAALYVDVESAEVHLAYARALAATGDHPDAAFEAESALLCEAQPHDKAAAHALLARERLALGDPAGARAHREEALKLDPENAEARALKP